MTRLRPRPLGAPVRSLTAMRHARRPLRGVRRAVPAAALAAALAAGWTGGCATGARPNVAEADTFSSGPPVGDPAIDAVRTLLERPPTLPLTASYHGERRMGSVRTVAEIHLERDATRVRIGTVTFVVTTAGAQTCLAAPAGDDCSRGLNQARISDTGATMSFYRSDAAKRLRRASVSATGPGVARTETIAGRPATCVDVPFGENTATYCADVAGVIAKVVEGDVLIDATAISG